MFPLAHNIDPTSVFGAWILERFDILPLALLTPLIAAALSSVPRMAEGNKTVGGGLTAVAGLLLVRQLIFSAWHGVPADNVYVERYSIDALQSPDPDRRAIIVGTDDHRIFPILYAQEVLERSPSVLYIDGSLLMHAWYRAWLRGHAGFEHLPDIDKPVRLVTTIGADPTWADVDLYLSNDFSRHSHSLPRVPQGVIYRLFVRPGAPPPTIDDVLTRHRAALGRIGPLPANQRTMLTLSRATWSARTPDARESWPGRCVPKAAPTRPRH